MITPLSHSRSQVDVEGPGESTRRRLETITKHVYRQVMEPVSHPAAPELRNDSPRWTDWGWPPRPTVQCPGCPRQVDTYRGTYVAHPHPTNPTALCAASEQPTDGTINHQLLTGGTR